jgi:hypothetical protein
MEASRTLSYRCPPLTCALNACFTTHRNAAAGKPAPPPSHQQIYGVWGMRSGVGCSDYQQCEQRDYVHKNFWQRYPHVCAIVAGSTLCAVLFSA